MKAAVAVATAGTVTLTRLVAAVARCLALVAATTAPCSIAAVVRRNAPTVTLEAASPTAVARRPALAAILMVVVLARWARVIPCRANGDVDGRVTGSGCVAFNAGSDYGSEGVRRHVPTLTLMTVSPAAVARCPTLVTTVETVRSVTAIAHCPALGATTAALHPDAACSHCPVQTVTLMIASPLPFPPIAVVAHFLAAPTAFVPRLQQLVVEFLWSRPAS